MEYEEIIGSPEFIKEKARQRLQGIRKNGYQYRGIDLMKYPEESMTDDELKQKRKVDKEVVKLKRIIYGLDIVNDMCISLE